VALFTMLLLVAALPRVAADDKSAEYRIDIQDKVQLSDHDPRGKKPGKLWVTVNFKVKRAVDGTVVTSLPKTQFEVEENNEKIADFDLYQPTATSELTTVLAMDISGSMASGHRIEESKAAAKLFLNLLQSKADTGLILFDHELRVKEPPIGDPTRYREHRDKVIKLVDEKAVPMGGTAYLNAAYEAVEMLEKKTSGRRAVVLLTDGIDLNSDKTLEEVIDKAQKANVPIYTLGIGEPGRGEHVSTVLVLDHSGSMRDKADDQDPVSKIKALHRAASRFIDIMRPGAMMTLQPFSDKVELNKPFAGIQQTVVVPPDQHVVNQDKLSREDRKKLEQREKALAENGRIREANKGVKDGLKADVLTLKPKGGTLLYDATYSAIATLAAQRPAGKRAVVVMTDGVDESPGSRHTVEEVIAFAKEQKVPLYMLGLGREREINKDVMQKMATETGGSFYHARNEKMLIDIFEKLSIDIHDEGIDEQSLTRLAEETGGKYYPARDVSKLKIIYEELAQEFQSTYTITFASRRPNHDGTARDISIFVLDPQGHRISTGGKAQVHVHGIIVAETNSWVYLGVLVVLGAFLAVPLGMRRLTRSATAK